MSSILTFQVNNLAQPYGICNHKQLKHSDFYTTEECYLECLTTMAQKQCGCSNIYMTQTSGEGICCCHMIVRTVESEK